MKTSTTLSSLTLAFAVSILSLAPTVLRSQETASAGIVGHITDSTGASVSEAKVTVLNVDTNASRSAQSDAQGAFSVPNLAPARYQVRIEKTGFQTAIVEPFELRIGEVVQRSVQLTVGAVNESVTVEARAPLLQTEGGSVNQVIDQRQITELPLNGRNLVQLATLSAGVSPQQPLSRSSAQYGNRNEYVTVEGGRDSSTNYVIDGVYARSLRFNNLELQPSVDAIQEFNVLRNSFSTEYGQGAAVVTAVTKSGTNQLHGSAFEFLRNDVLDARNFFTAKKPAYRRNQFGGTVGAPIIKDKFFVFGGYEGLKTRQGQPFLGSVPNPTLLTGDLSSIAKPVIDPTTGAAFSNNRIPLTRLSHFAQVLSPTIPAPNNSGANNYLVNKTFVDDYSTVTFRSDQVLSPKHSLFERYIWYDASQISPSTFTTTNYPQSAQNLAVGDTYVFTPTLINDLRLGYNRANSLWKPVSLGGSNWDQLLGFQNLAGAGDPLDFGRPSFTIAGFSGQGEGPYTQGAIENTYSLSDAVSKVVGKHTIRTGVQAQNRRFNHITEILPRGNFSFNGNFSENSIADYLLGYCSECDGALGSSRSNYHSNTVAFFINDDWQVSKKITLNLGLRYDYLGTWREVDNNEASFDPATGKLAYHKVPANVPPALAPLIINQNNFYPAGIVKPDLNNFGPRVGLAYRLTDNWVIRSGFGVFYDNPNLNELQFTRIILPFYGYQTIIPDKSKPISVDTLFPSLSQVTSLPAPFSTMSDNRTPYVLEWNFDVQRTLWGNLLLDIGYTGSGGRKLPRRFNQNQADFGTTPIIDRLPYPAWQPGIFTAINDGLSNFNAVSIRVEKRYSNGLSFLGNYQFSTNIDTDSGEADNAVAYRTNTRLQRGLSIYDQRQRAVVSASYELPFGKGKAWLSNRGFASAVLGGWQAQGILSLLTGLPFTPTGPAVCNCGSYVSQWVNATRPGFGKLSDPTPNLWFDPTAFALPATGFQGTAGRNILYGPGRKQLDFSLFRIFPLTERAQLQLRAEFFDVFNHPNFGTPDANISDTTAGVISSAYDGRDIQFGLRMVW